MAQSCTKKDRLKLRRSGLRQQRLRRPELRQEWLWAGVLVAAVVVGVLSVTGCSAETATRTCQVHAECESGTCLPDGTCAPKAVADAGGGDVSARWQPDGATGGTDDTAGGGQSDAGGGTAADAGKVKVDAGPKDAGSASEDGSGTAAGCKPNHDGTISAAEAPYGANLAATFRVAVDAAVDMKGTVLSDGMRVWDLSAALPGDQNVLVKTLPLTDMWFAQYFAGASYAAPMNADEALLGVFEMTNKALLLRGVASQKSGLFATRLVYDPPVPLLSFPLKVGTKWQVNASVTGLAQGIIAAYSESYASEVDAGGALKTPFGNFPTLRVRTLMTRKLGLMITTVRSFLFAAECFGTVASVRSKDGEQEVEFGQATEVRRLTP